LLDTSVPFGTRGMHVIWQNFSGVRWVISTVPLEIPLLPNRSNIQHSRRSHRLPARVSRATIVRSPEESAVRWFIGFGDRSVRCFSVPIARRACRKRIRPPRRSRLLPVRVLPVGRIGVPRVTCSGI
jgi:hypothetical protein